MRMASAVVIADGADAKSFTADEFRRLMRSSFFVGAVSFWRMLKQLTTPERITRLHANGVLMVPHHNCRFDQKYWIERGDS